MAIEPVIPIQKFDDVARVFVEGEIDLSEIVEIADKATTHYGFGRALQCVRVGLGTGKWAYVAAMPMPTPQSDPAATLRAKWQEWKDEHATTTPKKTTKTYGA